MTKVVRSNKFQAVMLMVYKAKDGACQLVAETMEPLEEGQKTAAKPVSASK